MSGFDLKNLFETAQKVQSEIARVKDELGAKTVEGEAGGGLVRCVANGKGEVVSVHIDPSVINALEPRLLEDLVAGAVNLALDKVKELAQSEMARAAGGLPLPPGFFGGGGGA
ncbi:MAG: YbaB/EbfC family nucleoid-associated protein [Myxococcales bacterium]|nr:YbaB/EbfC family nucleoid-associated protein [Myxococcales bacterium]